MNGEPATRKLALQDLCRFLAACYYEPGPEFREEKVFASMAAAGAAIAPVVEDAARRLGDGFEHETMQDLLVDYTRLFLGPVNVVAQPYESCWLDAAGADPDSTRAIEAFYREAGLDLSNDFHERSDHIAAELECLYLLRARENQGRAAGDVQATANAEALRKRLVTRHLGRWIPKFADAMKYGAATDYYRVLADLTTQYVALEMAEIC